MNSTSENLDPTLQDIIQRITENLAVEEIYLYPFRTQGKLFKQLYVLLRHEGGQEIISARALCNVAVSEKVGYQANVLFSEDVNRQINDGNIRVTLIYHPDNRVYESPGQGVRVAFQKVNYEKRYKKAVQYFEKEITKIYAFEKGYRLYMKNGNYSQASFMLHQVIELGFRLGENIIMGKAKMTHSIRKHQEYIRTFSPEMGSLFAEVEWDILRKLDESYSSARYDHNFSVSKEDLLWAADKAKELLVYLTAFNRDLLGEIEQRKELVTADDEPMPLDGASEEAKHANVLMGNEVATVAETESTDEIEEGIETTVIKPCETADDHRECILAAIRTYFTPTHVFCFAYQSRQENSQNLVTPHYKKSSYHRYYLAIVTDDQPDQALHKQHQINEALGSDLEVVALYFKLSTFNKKLEEGHGFFYFLVSDAEEWKAGCGLSTQGITPKTVDVEKQRWIWKRHFWSAEGLLEMVEDHIGSRYDECCAVLMSQAMEQLCLGLLYAFWGYRPDNFLNLMYLVKLTECISPIAKECFNLDIPEERAMIVDLSKALNEFRYNANFDANEYALHILEDRLQKFSNEVDKLVSHHFETLASANQ